MTSITFAIYSWSEAIYSFMLKGKGLYKGMSHWESPLGVTAMLVEWIKGDS